MKKCSLIKYDPITELWDFPAIFGRLSGTKAFYPAVDVNEDKKNITVTAELPGVDKDQLELSLENGLLTIKGEKKNETEVKKEDYYHLERSYGSFQRTIELPADVDEAKTKASYKKGVLEIVMQKKTEGSKKETKIKVE